MMRFCLLLVACLLMAMAGRAAGAEPDSGSASNPKAQLERIRSTPPYQEWKKRQERDLDVDGVLKDSVDGIHQFFRRISDFFSRPPQPAPQHNNAPAAVQRSSNQDWFTGDIWKRVGWIALTILVILICYFLIRRLMMTPPPLTTARVLSREAIQEAMESGEALALAPDEWMDEARRLAAEQNFRAVYRALYLALLSGLHSNGKIEHSRNRTNWYYVQHYRGPDGERPMFEHLTDLFDRVWYGHKQAPESRLEELQQQVKLLTAGGEVAQ